MKRLSKLMFALLLVAVAVVMPSCQLYEASDLDGKWLCLEKNNTEATMLVFNADSEKGYITIYSYSGSRWIEESRRQFTYDFSEYTGSLTLYYGLSSEDLDVQTLGGNELYVEMNGKDKVFHRVKSADIDAAVKEVLGDYTIVIDDGGGTDPTNPTVPTDTDYAPANSSVRNYHFSVSTGSQNLEVYFAGQYSVDSEQSNTINGEKTLAEYEHMSTNIAKIKYGKNRGEEMMLYFMNGKGGTAIYDNKEVGTFSFEKYK